MPRSTLNDRPAPITTVLETRAPDGTVLARIQRTHKPKPMPDSPTWVLVLFPDSEARASALKGNVWERDGRYATRAITEDDARRTLDYATHVLLTYLESVDQAQTLLERGLDKAASLAAQETLPLGDRTDG